MFVRVTIIALFVAARLAPAQQPASAWSDRETRLANEYLSLLVEKPEYGRVVDLLWQLYDKRGATAVLLENIHAQAQQTRHPAALLVEAHLVRKSGDTKKAAALYDDILKLDAKNTIALRARAELASESGSADIAQAMQQRLVDSLPDSDPAKTEAILQLGNLAFAADQTEAAAEAWQKAAALHPQDLALARTVAQLMLRAGYPQRAVAMLDALAKGGEPQQRLDALYDLARVHEQADQFTQADQALRSGLGLLDFRDTRYAQFFLRRVRLHERFDSLDELRNELLKEARKQPATEKALHDMMRYCTLTVDADERVTWLRELTRAVPGSDDYRWELVRALLDHEGAAEAAQILDSRLKNDATDVPALVLLRAEADLRGGRSEDAVNRAARLLEQQPAIEVEKQVLAFAQERSLDSLVEKILRRRLERDGDKPEHVFELAAFLRAHAQAADATALLQAFANRAPTPPEQARRMNDAAAFLAAGGDDDEALKLQSDAAKLSGGGRDELVRLADFMAGAGNSAEALAQLEAALTKATTFEERADIDDRIYSVLLGDQREAAPKIRSVTRSEFTVPSFIDNPDFGSSAPVQERSFTSLPAAVKAYADRVLQPALADAAGPDVLARAIWWCSRTGQTKKAYELVSKLITDPASHQRRDLPLEVERLCLDVALADENPVFARRQLDLLIERDPSNAVRYLLRLAELHLAGNDAETAVKDLKRALAEQPGNESVLTAITQCLQLLRRQDEALTLWRDAIQRAPASTSTTLRERYADLLLRANKLGDYVETQISILEQEPDIKRRREIFRRFLDQLLWSGVPPNDAAQNAVQERLKLVEGRLLERTRRHPFDGFYHEALAAVFEKRGDAAHALASMKQAYYTSPDALFSVEQLRAAALRAGDLKSAIYFQKQVAAKASTKDLAAESRQLIQLLEQTFQIAEADKVRRRLESRLSQDPQALEDLAQYYKESGQDEAERRVYEQIQRVRSWDPRSALRLALKCIALADESAAEQQLRQVLARAQPRSAAKAQPPDRWPFPLSDERKPGAAASLKELVDLLDGAHGLHKDEADRVRTFLSFPRAEFVELPDDVSLLRLRAIEELAKLLRRTGGRPLTEWIASTVENTRSAAIERMWALFYAGAHPEFRRELAACIETSESLDLEFTFAWLMIRAGGMKETLAWTRAARIGSEAQDRRKRMLQTVLDMLTDNPAWRLDTAEFHLLGQSRSLHVAALDDIVRRLSESQRHEEAIALLEATRRQSPQLWGRMSWDLANLAEAAEHWDQQRRYLHDAVRGSIQGAGMDDQGMGRFIASVTALLRLSRTPQERDETLQEALDALHAAPRNSDTIMRQSAVTALAGALDPAARHLAGVARGTMLTGRALADSTRGLMPQGTVRNDESNYLRSYWEDIRLLGAVLAQQGLGDLANAVDASLDEQIGSVQLGPRTSDTFSLWRATRLVRRLRDEDYPTRRRLIREYLASTDMKEEDSIEVLLELGRELEVAGMLRECIDVYRLLPDRSPNNNLYAEFFIRVSELSWEPQPARDYVEDLFGRDPVRKPQSLGDETLREKDARFLAMERNFAKLRELSRNPEGFSRVLTGRIAPEVPYARELALLLEHDGDTKGALAAWNQMHEALINGTPDNPLPPDAECALHRARLMVEMKAPERAHEVLGEVKITEALDETRVDLLKLRAKLAAQINRWDDVRDLMTIAVDKRSPELVLALTTELRAAGRSADALNLLTQAERTMKAANERFLLRLEQLRFYAAEKSWTPESGRVQIAALLRSGGRDPAAMTAFCDWISSRPPLAESWLRVLRSEARSGGDPALAAAGLCALASSWPSSAMPAEITPVWTRAAERDRPCVELAARQLLKHGKPAHAWSACETLRAIPAGMHPRLTPIAAETAGALHDETLLRELYAEIVRMPFPGGALTGEWANAFTAASKPAWAAELYDLAEIHMQRTARANPPLTQAHIEFLITQKQFEAAENLLVRHYQSFTAQSPALIVRLYRDWQKLDGITAELPKYFLPEGVRNEVLFLAGHL